VVENGTIEFLVYGFLLVFSSNYRLTTHRHERDQPTINQPTTSRHDLSQYAPLTAVSEAHKKGKNSVFLQVLMTRLHVF